MLEPHSNRMDHNWNLCADNHAWDWRQPLSIRDTHLGRPRYHFFHSDPTQFMCVQLHTYRRLVECGKINNSYT